MDDYKRCRLTTSDNPYNPFTQFDLWWDYDVKQCRYMTCERIDSIALTSDELSDQENEPELQRAYDVIIKHGAINPFTGKRVEYLRIYEE